MRDVALLVNERKRRMEALETIAAWAAGVEGWEVRSQHPTTLTQIILVWGVHRPVTIYIYSVERSKGF